MSQFIVLFGLIALVITQIAAQSSCPDEQIVVLGKQGKIVCNIPYLQGHRTWRIGQIRHNELLPLDSEDYEVEPDGVFIKEVNENHTGSSLFFDISHPVTGKTIFTKIIRITVHSPPEIHALKSSQDLDVGNTVGCMATGTPRPTIRWVHNLNRDNIVFNETVKHTDFVFTSFINVEESGIGNYQCIATNEIGSALDNVYVYSGQHNHTENGTEHELLLGIHDVRVVSVTDSSATFEITLKNYTDSTHIYYFYTDHGLTDEQQSSQIDIQPNNRYTLSGFPKGSSFTIHFAAANMGQVGWASTKGLRVDLLPPVPEMTLRSAADDTISIQWAYPNGNIDFFEIQQTQLEENTLIPCSVNIKLLPCSDNVYKLYRLCCNQSYTQIKIRSHNAAGFSEWKQLMVPPFSR